MKHSVPGPFFFAGLAVRVFNSVGKEFVEGNEFLRKRASFGLVLYVTLEKISRKSLRRTDRLQQGRGGPAPQRVRELPS